MAYEKKDWKTDEVITETDLDRMEQGIADANAISGLTGEAVAITPLAGTEDAAAIATKVNEIITQLQARGVIAGEPLEKQTVAKRR